jgi:crossover junction endodeoxyribonuclease RuvC
MKYISIGLDLSLCRTGISIIERDGVSKKEAIETSIVTSKPPEEKSYATEALRLLEIASSILKVEERFDFKKVKVLFVLEGFAYLAHNTSAVFQLAGLSYLIRTSLAKRSIPFVVVQPTTLKKFITGKGHSPKDIVMMDILRLYDRRIIDNNEADAFGLARIGMDLMQGSKKLLKHQEEVLTLLRSQL